jgi:hypothetical protein
VGVVDLGRTRPFGGEGGLGVGRHHERVAVDERDRVPGPPERQGGGEAGDARPHHHDTFR